MFLIIILLLLGVFLVKSYNRLQGMAQKVKASDSNIKSAIFRKVELTNKLMDIARGYAEHEKLIFIKTSDDFSSAYKDSSESLANLRSLELHYPELKADRTYLDLSEKITENEDIILSRRDYYNSAAELYNAEKFKFPFNLFANSLGFKEAPYIDLESSKKIKDFTTDDGEIIKAMFKSVADKTTDVSKKGIEKLQEAKNKMSNREETENENSKNMEEK